MALPDAGGKDRNPWRFRAGPGPGLRIFSRIFLPPAGDVDHPRHAYQPAALSTNAAGSIEARPGSAWAGETHQSRCVGLLPAAAISEFGGVRVPERNSFRETRAITIGRAGLAKMGATGRRR